MNRNLDLRYFPMQRDGRLQHVCFTDLTSYERDRVLHGQSAEWLERLCRDLANAIQETGDKLDLSRDGNTILIRKLSMANASSSAKPKGKSLVRPVKKSTTNLAKHCGL